MQVYVCVCVCSLAPSEHSPVNADLPICMNVVFVWLPDFTSSCHCIQPHFVSFPCPSPSILTPPHIHTIYIPFRTKDHHSLFVLPPLPTSLNSYMTFDKSSYTELKPLRGGVVRTIHNKLPLRDRMSIRRCRNEESDNANLRLSFKSFIEFYS